MRYVLLFVETEQYDRDLEAMTQADRDRAYELVADWFAEHASKISAHGKLASPLSATTVRLDRGGSAQVLDGPFVEGKEVVSGYAEIEVANLDEALHIVSSWPGCPVVEIRPLAT